MPSKATISSVKSALGRGMARTAIMRAFRVGGYCVSAVERGECPAAEGSDAIEVPEGNGIVGWSEAGYEVPLSCVVCALKQREVVT